MRTRTARRVAGRPVSGLARPKAAGIADQDGCQHERGQDRTGLDPDRVPPPGRCDEPGGQREVDGAGEGAENRQPDDRARGRRGRGAGGGRLRDVVKAESPDQATAAGVGGSERQQRTLRRCGEHRACSGHRSEQEDRPRAPAVQHTPGHNPQDAGNDQDRAEDRPERRIRPVRVGADRLDQHPICVVTRAIGDDREQPQHRNRQNRRARLLPPAHAGLVSGTRLTSACRAASASLPISDTRSPSSEQLSR
jgi:hypothetical protein